MYTVTRDVTQRLCTAWLGEDAVDTGETVTRDCTGSPGRSLVVVVCVHACLCAYVCA